MSEQQGRMASTGGDRLMGDAPRKVSPIAPPVYCFAVRPGCYFWSRDDVAQFRVFNDSGRLLRVTVELLT